MWSWDAPGNLGFMCENHDVVVSSFFRGNCGNLLLRSIFQIPTNKDFTSFVFDWLLIMSQIRFTGWFLLVMSIHEHHLGWHVVWFPDHSGLYNQIMWKYGWWTHMLIILQYCEYIQTCIQFFIYISCKCSIISGSWDDVPISSATKPRFGTSRNESHEQHLTLWSGKHRDSPGRFFLIWFLWMKNWGESGEVRLVFLAADDWILRALYGWWCWMCFLK